ncbi:MAG: 50S ribosomal protein L30 [Promethearchaeota archaeon]
MSIKDSNNGSIAPPGTVIVPLPKEKEKIKAKTLSDVLLVAIRIRGNVKKTADVKKTMGLLKLHKKHHAVLLPATKSINGMLFKVKDFIAYGIIDKPTLLRMMKKRGQLRGRRPLTEDAIKALSPYEDFDSLADALLSLEYRYEDIKKIVPVFRLHPPKGGFPKGIKVPFALCGVLGFHARDINKLLTKMI